MVDGGGFVNLDVQDLLFFKYKLENYMNKFEHYQYRLSELELETNKYLRYGQQCFNLLYDIDPDVANEIRGTKLDPFYDDNKLSSFFNYIEDALTTNQ